MGIAVELFIVRHAEAAGGTPDAQRELTAAGHERAAQLGAELAALDFGAVLASSATRAQQTLAGLSAAHQGAWPTPTSSTELYEATAATWLSALQVLPPPVARALIIGHNPTLGQLATSLLGTYVSLRPGDCLQLRGAISWAQLGPATLHQATT